MKFNKVLQPEVALGLRKWPETIVDIGAQLYQNIIPRMYFIPGQGFSFPNAMIEKKGSGFFPEALFADMILSWKFTKERPRIYHSPRPFLEALAKIDREIPVDLLPERFFGYFSFAENTVFDGQDFVQGMYVFIGPSSETNLPPTEVSEKVFWAVYYTAPTQDRPGVERARMLIDITNDKFKKMADRYEVDESSLKTNDDVFRLGLNLALYVNSIGCDLVEAPPVRKMKPAEKKNRTKNGEVMNQCHLPVTLVSWNYQHPRHYNVDSTWVDTFMRWQRCGPQNSQVKLIWVTPHERNFKKDGDEG